MVISAGSLVGSVVPGSAQGISISPLTMEAEVPTGRNIEIPFTLANSSNATFYELTVEHVELIQDEDGAWEVKYGAAAFDPQIHRSNLEWFDPVAPSRTVPPQTTTQVVLSGTVPRNVRGTYFSALLVTSSALGDSSDAVRIRFQFLVPIILTIQGRSARQNITMSGMDLALENATLARGANAPMVAVAEAMISNMGETYSRLGGSVRVERAEGESWRLVTIAELPDRGIIPGSQFALPTKLGRSLPSGRYRLTGNLQVDGRQTPRVVSEIDFAGDPNLDSVAYDSSIKIEPELIQVQVRKGAARTQPIKLTNPGDSPIEVRLTPAIPKALDGVAMGDVMGLDLSAAEWTEVRPESVLLRPNSSRNVRMITRLPNEAPDHPYYYANIDIESFHPDGQSAGSSTALVVLEHQPENARRGLFIERLSHAEGESSAEQIVQTRVVNIGNVHLNLRPSASLVTSGGRVVKEITLEGGEDYMVPLSVWNFAGMLDISDVEDGSYTLRASFGFNGNNRETSDLTVAVTTGEDGVKTLSSSVD